MKSFDYQIAQFTTEFAVCDFRLQQKTIKRTNTPAIFDGIDVDQTVNAVSQFGCKFIYPALDCCSLTQTPHVIWNRTTKAELLQGLWTEITDYRLSRQVATALLLLVCEGCLIRLIAAARLLQLFAVPFQSLLSCFRPSRMLRGIITAITSLSTRSSDISKSEIASSPDSHANSIAVA